MNVMQPGFFISIEGSEGAGKTTAKEYIIAYLQDHRIPHLATREPGGTQVAEALRQILLMAETKETITPMTELLLMFAGRSQHIQNVILPALEAGTWVVSDRYVDASYAYQGGGRNMDMLMIELLDKWIVANHYPNLTILLDLPPDLGMIRLKNRGGTKDRIETEKLEFFNRVRQVYLQRAEEDPERIKVIDASKSLPDVQKQIHDVLSAFVNRVGKT